MIGPARGRDFVTFTGTAGQVERAFHTSIHRYEVRGEKHYANASEPSVPAQFADLIAGVRGLHNFHPKSFRRAGLPPVKLKPGVMKPDFYTQTSPGVNLLAPDDLWSGAIARNASIVYVYATDPFNPVFYAIDQAVAPVISFSFG